MTTPPATAIWPSLHYADARAGIEFLERALGFTTKLVVPNPDDDAIVEHCQMSGPEGGGIMLGTANRAGNKFSQRPTGTASTYLVVAEIDALYKRAVDAGAEIFHEIEDQDYGSTRLQHLGSRRQHLELRHLRRRVAPSTTRLFDRFMADELSGTRVLAVGRPASTADLRGWVPGRR